MNSIVRGSIVGALAVAVTAAAAAFFLSREASQAREQAENAVATAAGHAAEEVSSRIQAYFAAKKTSAGGMADYMKNLPSEMRSNFLQLKLLHAKYKDFGYLFLLDDSGKLLSTDSPDKSQLEQKKWTESDEFEKAQKAGQPVAGETLLHEGGAITLIGAPIPSAKGGGVVGGAVELFKATDIGKDLERPSGSHLFVSTDDGKLVGMVAADGLTRDAGEVPAGLWQSITGSGLKLGEKGQVRFSEGDQNYLAASVPVSEGKLAVVVDAPLAAAATSGPGSGHVFKGGAIGLALAIVAAVLLSRLAPPGPLTPAAPEGPFADPQEIAHLKTELSRAEQERERANRDLERLREEALNATQRADTATRELTTARDAAQAGAEKHEALTRDLEVAKQAAETAVNASKTVSPELRETLDRKIEVDRIKSDAIFTVSKELSSSFSIIKNFIYKLLTASKDKQMEHAAQEFLDKLVATTAPLERLMEDLVNFSQLSSGEKEPDLQRVDLAPLIQRIVAESKPLADAKRLALTVAIAKDAGELECDPAQIGMVLTNLVKNAIKFTPKEGKVSIEAGPHESGVLVAVLDSGKKIQVSADSKVFLQFEGTNTSLTKKIGGTGLRMPIMQSILHAHGGRLWIDHQGEYNRFAFTLPRTQASRGRRPA